MAASTLTRAYILFTAVSAVLAPQSSGAADKISDGVMMQGVMIGPDPAGGQEESVSNVRIHLHDDAARIEFGGSGNGEANILLAPAGGGQAWIINEQAGAALPVSLDNVLGDLLVNPRRPCTAMGMSARCEATGPRMIAGILTTGWRYRRARGRGPGGTDDGEFWVDSDTGLVLAYTGKAGRRHGRRSFQASSIAYRELPAELFKLPTSYTLPAEADNDLEPE